MIHCRTYISNIITLTVFSFFLATLISPNLARPTFVTHGTSHIESSAKKVYQIATIKERIFEKNKTSNTPALNLLVYFISNFTKLHVDILLIISYLLLLSILSILSLKSWSLQKQFLKQINKLEGKVLHLSKSREYSITLQKEILHLSTNNNIQNTDIKPIKGCRKRILAYTRNELVPIAIQDISYVYVENQNTYIIKKNGNRSTTNVTLSDIYSCLDKSFFFKVNRQVIISISSINKILKIDESKLKIEIFPMSTMTIVIGKNKVSEFKKWLDI